ncbi:MAG: hypothetical protein FWF00_06500 [Endomicrobia bacterium]|nr:hypothetical protein [Endomicrobiia bacterium]MCL2507314.1 hypothetical protein [Endomicrobiia bacterium]
MKKILFAGFLGIILFALAGCNATFLDTAKTGLSVLDAVTKTKPAASAAVSNNEEILISTATAASVATSRDSGLELPIILQGDGTVSTFEGEWIRLRDKDYNPYFDSKFVFKGNEFAFYTRNDASPDWIYRNHGNFTYDDSYIHLNTPYHYNFVTLKVMVVDEPGKMSNSYKFITPTQMDLRSPSQKKPGIYNKEEK